MRPAVVVLLALCACGGNAPQKAAPRLNRWGKPLSSRPVPEWVDKLPQSSRTRVVAVGRSGPTFWPQDALNNAREDARGKVALQLAAHVERYGAATDASGRAARAVDIDKEATDLLLRNARIEATWVDEAGDRDQTGSVWALAVLDLDAQGRPVQAAAGTPVNGNAMPSWLERLPDSPGKVYATGYSGPTFRPEKAVGYAGDAAVDNLAKTLRSRVQAYQLLVQNATGLSVDEFSHTEDPEQSFRDLVQKGARIEQVWVDEDGVRPGDPPGSAWALAVIEVPTTAGSYQPIENPDIGPALDKQGNLPEHRKD
ncbi:MAG TPA: hypothetical protein VEQ15_14380 [Myxococcales bacterium]|nr:hypothetical protein [Myxococcales bacterium]